MKLLEKEISNIPKPIDYVLQSDFSKTATQNCSSLPCRLQLRLYHNFPPEPTKKRFSTIHRLELPVL